MSTILDPVRTHAGSAPDRLALGDAVDGRTWSYRQMDTAIDRMAAWLVERFGPGSGERVATLGRNSCEQLILHYACVRAGAIHVPFNWRLAQAEIAALMSDAGVALVFHDSDFAVPDTGCEARPSDDLRELGVKGSAAPLEARREWHVPSLFLYTSGTSGRPKGVLVSEENIFWSNTNFALGSLVDRDSVFLCDMPMFHTAGLVTVCRVPLLYGAALWISPGFDPVRTIGLIGDPERGISHYFSVPQMATVMWQHADFTPEKFSRLKIYVTGGAPNPKAQVERFAKAGIRFSDGFGMTETGSNFAMPVEDVARLIEKAGSCGQPLMGMQVRVVDEEGNDVADGQTGELWLSGPSVTQGYWNQPETTAKAFEGHWFKTGDAVMKDPDGFYFLVDRKKDMYISGGENVYPAEVEAVIAELANVAESAVIGVPDERWGEVGKAFVIVKAGSSLSAEEVQAHCLSRLAKFKVPASVVLTDNIPRTASGKVQKHVLKKLAGD